MLFIDIFNGCVPKWTIEFNYETLSKLKLN